MTEPQFKFLRLLSSKAEQKFVLSCHNTVGWYDETTRDYSNALTMKSYDNTEVTYSPEETRFAIAEDSCSVKSQLKIANTKVNSRARAPMARSWSPSTQEMLIFFRLSISRSTTKTLV